MEARCEECGVAIPEADFATMVLAEEANRQQGRHAIKLLCHDCWQELQDNHDTGPGFL